MKDEIGLDEDIEPTADATEGVMGGVATNLDASIGKKLAEAGGDLKASPLTSPKEGLV